MYVICSFSSCVQVEELFQSEQGISYFSVSPDSRYVVIVTGQNVLLLLTLPDLETTSQYELFEGASENNSVTESVKVVWRKDSHYFAVIYKNIDSTGNFSFGILKFKIYRSLKLLVIYVYKISF